MEYLLCAVYCFRPGAESGECEPCSLVELGCTEGRNNNQTEKSPRQVTSSWKVRHSFDKGRAGQDSGGEQEVREASGR